MSNPNQFGNGGEAAETGWEGVANLEGGVSQNLANSEGGVSQELAREAANPDYKKENGVFVPENPEGYEKSDSGLLLPIGAKAVEEFQIPKMAEAPVKKEGLEVWNDPAYRKQMHELAKQRQEENNRMIDWDKVRELREAEKRLPEYQMTAEDLNGINTFINSQVDGGRGAVEAMIQAADAYIAQMEGVDASRWSDLEKLKGAHDLAEAKYAAEEGRRRLETMGKHQGAVGEADSDYVPRHGAGTGSEMEAGTKARAGAEAGAGIEAGAGAEGDAVEGAEAVNTAEKTDTKTDVVEADTGEDADEGAGIVIGKVGRPGGKAGEAGLKVGKTGKNGKKTGAADGAKGTSKAGETAKGEKAGEAGKAAKSEKTKKTGEDKETKERSREELIAAGKELVPEYTAVVWERAGAEFDMNELKGAVQILEMLTDGKEEEALKYVTDNYIHSGRVMGTIAIVRPDGGALIQKALEGKWKEGVSKANQKFLKKYAKIHEKSHGADTLSAIRERRAGGLAGGASGGAGAGSAEADGVAGERSGERVVDELETHSKNAGVAMNMQIDFGKARASLEGNRAEITRQKAQFELADRIVCMLEDKETVNAMEFAPLFRNENDTALALVLKYSPRGVEMIQLIAEGISDENNLPLRLRDRDGKRRTGDWFKGWVDRYEAWAGSGPDGDDGGAGGVSGGEAGAPGEEDTGLADSEVDEATSAGRAEAGEAGSIGAGSGEAGGSVAKSGETGVGEAGGSAVKSGEAGKFDRPRLNLVDLSDVAWFEGKSIRAKEINNMAKQTLLDFRRARARQDEVSARHGVGTLDTLAIYEDRILELLNLAPEDDTEAEWNNLENAILIPITEIYENRNDYIRTFMESNAAAGHYLDEYEAGMEEARKRAQAARKENEDAIARAGVEEEAARKAMGGGGTNGAEAGEGGAARGTAGEGGTASGAADGEGAGSSERFHSSYDDIEPLSEDDEFYVYSDNERTNKILASKVQEARQKKGRERRKALAQLQLATTAMNQAAAGPIDDSILKRLQKDSSKEARALIAQLSQEARRQMDRDYRLRNGIAHEGEREELERERREDAERRVAEAERAA